MREVVEIAHETEELCGSILGAERETYETGRVSLWIVKVIFGYRKTRYRGLFKNHLHQLSLFLLANFYRLRHHPLLRTA